MDLRQKISVLKDIKLEKCKVIGIEDFKNNSKDRVAVYMEGEMIDYIIDESISNEIVDKVMERFKKLSGFREIWYFNRIGNNWYADEINDEVGISDIKNIKNIIEK